MANMMVNPIKLLVVSLLMWEMQAVMNHGIVGRQQAKTPSSTLSGEFRGDGTVEKISVKPADLAEGEATEVTLDAGGNVEGQDTEESDEEDNEKNEDEAEQALLKRRRRSRRRSISQGGETSGGEASSGETSEGSEASDGSEASPVVTGGLNANSCPSGSVKIMTRAACHQAAPQLGEPLGTWTNTGNSGEVNSTHEPSGCFLNGNGQVFFNTHASGSSSPTCRPICEAQNGGAFVYKGCYENDHGNRVGGHTSGKTFDECEQMANDQGKTTFGMEYPQCCSTAGQAQCLVLDAMPSMNKLPDSECEAEGLFNGKRLGSGNRLAIYHQAETTTWVLYSKGSFGTQDIGENEFDKFFKKGAIVHRVCAGCSASHKNIYYKRLTDVPSTLSGYDLFLQNWFNSPKNVLNTDFKLYSSFQDLTDDQNAWVFCNYNDAGVGFPRDCGPSGPVGAQWNSLHRGGQANIKFTVMMTEAPLDPYTLYAENSACTATQWLQGYTMTLGECKQLCNDNADCDFLGWEWKSTSGWYACGWRKSSGGSDPCNLIQGQTGWDVYQKASQQS